MADEAAVARLKLGPTSALQTSQFLGVSWNKSSNKWRAEIFHEGKRHRLREATVWMDPPSYYDPPGGLLSFELDVPHAMIFPPRGMDSVGHIQLIRYQLRQIKSALAIAHTLGRKLIMPRVVCGYDKAWFGTPSLTFARLL